MGLNAPKDTTRAKAKHRNTSPNKTSTAPSNRPVPGLAVRSYAADTLSAVIDGKTSLEGAFDHIDQSLFSGEQAGADRALAQALVLNALRRLPTLDGAINACLDAPLHHSAHQTMAILRIMAAQLLVMDMPTHAPVSLAVEDAVRRPQTRKFKGLVNALGRRMVREKDALLAKAPPSDVPGWLFARWAQTYGRKNGEAISAVMRQQPAIDLSLKPGLDRANLCEQLAQFGAIPVLEHSIRLQKPGSIDSLPGFDEGTWWVQDIAATLPALVLLEALPDPASAEIMDLCAAPGGKTAQLASSGAQVTALDQSKARMRRLDANMERLNLSVETIVGDAMKHRPETRYDAVLLDAPCSATGTLRRNPDIGYGRTQGDIATRVALQKRLLEQAASWVKPGGLLVYAVCSLEPEEGEGQIAGFLKRWKIWEIEPIDPATMPRKTVRNDGTVRTLPCSVAAVEGDEADAVKTGMDGFFIARLRNKARQ